MNVRSIDSIMGVLDVRNQQTFHWLIPETTLSAVHCRIQLVGDDWGSFTVLQVLLIAFSSQRNGHFVVDQCTICLDVFALV